jgi:hypothetical protein
MLSGGALPHPRSAARMARRRQAGLYSAADEMDQRDHDDGAQQCHQHGGKVDRIVDGPDVKDGADEVAGQEGARTATTMLINRLARSRMISLATQPITAATIRYITMLVMFILLS